MKMDQILSGVAAVVANIVLHFRSSSQPCHSYYINQTCCASGDSVFLFHRQSECFSFSTVHSYSFHFMMTDFLILDMRWFLGRRDLICTSYVDKSHSNKHEMNCHKTMNIVTWRLKVGMVEPGKTDIARQMLAKRVPIPKHCTEHASLWQGFTKQNWFP
jgi:hypothetical protein